MNEEVLQGPQQAPPPKKGRKKIFIALVTVASVIAVIASFLMIWYLADRYEDFEDNFTEEFSIPGLDEGFIPQGMGNYSSDNMFFISGYMNDGSASRIYVVEKDSDTGSYETLGYVTIITGEESVENDEGDEEETDGEESDDSGVTYTYYTGHACGVATNGNNFWLVSDATVYVLSYSDVVDNASPEGGSVTVSSTWDPNCAADFCYVSGSYLYVGEFYRKGNYETDESHHMTTSAGDQHYAVIFRYSATATSPTTPLRAYSITDRIQGMALSSDGNTMVLSQSYGLSNSHILVYDLSSAKTASTGITVGSSTITTYCIDSSILTEDYEIPSMSEGLCSVSVGDWDRVYVLFESASVKYKYFVRERIDSVYSFILK